MEMKINLAGEGYYIRSFYRSYMVAQALGVAGTLLLIAVGIGLGICCSGATIVLVVMRLKR